MVTARKSSTSTTSSSSTPQHQSYDIVILGGAFSGSCTAILTKRKFPDARILIIEKSEVFDRKVGESTSEVAGSFLTRIMGINTYLSQNHILKHGLRTWHANHQTEHFTQCSEIGPTFQVRLPTYQLDRSKLDLHLLQEAQKLGCELLRPAEIQDLELSSEDAPDTRHQITLKLGKTIKGKKAKTADIQAKWFVDATGKVAWLGRKLGNLEKLQEHPVNSMWSRFSGVRDMDDPLIATQHPHFHHGTHAPRFTATNHLMGDGWWSWIIPLQNGDVSAGLTYDSRHFSPHSNSTKTGGKKISDRLLEHLTSHPMGDYLFGDATPNEKDAHAYSNIPYYNSQPAGHRWVCVGDSAGFMDPLYSQGLDFCAHGIYKGFLLLSDALMGQKDDAEMRAESADFSRSFLTSYQRWYRSLYKNKYNYIGDWELMRAAYYMDLAAYFLGPVRLVQLVPEDEFSRFPYDSKPGHLFAHIMGFYNKRLSKLATMRKEIGMFGRQNTGMREVIAKGFAPDLKGSNSLFHKGIRFWLKCELNTRYHYYKHKWFGGKKKEAAESKKAPKADTAPATA